MSIGQLGTDPAKIVKTLTDILEIASHWKAVLLVDEVRFGSQLEKITLFKADIFLEERAERDIKRNAT